MSWYVKNIGQKGYGQTDSSYKDAINGPDRKYPEGKAKETRFNEEDNVFSAPSPYKTQPNSEASKEKKHKGRRDDGAKSTDEEKDTKTIDCVAAAIKYNGVLMEQVKRVGPYGLNPMGPARPQNPGKWVA